jgi:capsular polysaccharide biosynthesis protein
MNLLDYGQILVRRGWIMLLLAVVAGGAAFLFSRQMTPVYRSSLVVLVVPSRPDNGLQIASVNLLNNRAEYLRSGIVAAEVIDTLQLDMEPAVLLGATTITPNRDNMSLQIDVDLPAATDEEAARLLNPLATEWGNRLIQFQNELNQEAQRSDRIVMRPKDNPQVSLLRPNTRMNLLIGAVGGLLLGAVLIFVLEFLESSIVRRREDVERSSGMPVLASVPDAS